MSLFNDLWQLLRAHGSSAKRETECAALWSTYPPQTQQRIYDTIRTKLEQNKFVHYDPLRAMEFKSMSGVISRKRYPDGRVESVIATKRGTLYKRTCYPKGTFPRRG